MSRAATREGDKSRSCPPTPGSASSASDSSPHVPPVPFYPQPAYFSHPALQRPIQSAAPPYPQPPMHSVQHLQQQMQPVQLTPSNISQYTQGVWMQPQQQIQPQGVVQQPNSVYPTPFGYPSYPRPQQQQPQPLRLQPAQNGYGAIHSQTPHPVMQQPHPPHDVSHQSHAHQAQRPQHAQQPQHQQHFQNVHQHAQHAFLHHHAARPTLSSPPPFNAQGGHNPPHYSMQPFSSPPPPLHTPSGHNPSHYSVQSCLSPPPPDHSSSSQQTYQQQHIQAVQPPNAHDMQSNPMSMPQNISQQLRPSDRIVNQAFKSAVNNTLDLKGFQNVLADLCISRLSRDDLFSLFGKIDTLRNITISRDDFCNVLPKVLAFAAFARANSFEKDGLCLRKFHKALEFLGIELDQNATYEYFREADFDKDWVIDVQEFIKILPRMAHDFHTNFDAMATRFRTVAQQSMPEYGFVGVTATMANCAFLRACEKTKTTLDIKTFKEALQYINIDVKDKHNEVMQYFKFADTNRDGEICKKEFLNVFTGAMAESSNNA